MILLRHGQSEFNLHYGETRRDPGIVDPGLTEEGREQAQRAAAALAPRGIRLLLASPYRRTLETAQILAEALGLPVVVEPLVRERAYFLCDVGTPTSRLSLLWPALDFSALPERWWHEGEEPEHLLTERSRAFHRAMSRRADWRELAVVSHWGFIRGLTGQELTNGASLKFDPTAPAT